MGEAYLFYSERYFPCLIQEEVLQYWVRKCVQHYAYWIKFVI